ANLLQSASVTSTLRVPTAPTENDTGGKHTSSRSPSRWPWANERRSRSLVMTFPPRLDPRASRRHHNGRRRLAFRPRTRGMTRGFFEAFGRDPEGIWAAPGRLNIIGEFTDYNDGFVLPMAIDAVTTAAVARRRDDVIRVSSSGAPATTTPIASSRICNLTPGNTASWSSYAFGVVWAMTEAGHAIGGVDVFIESNVPIGAGLSSSAALECALGLALRDLFASTISLQDLALLCQRAENAYVGVPSGIMDQTASLCCTAGHAIEFDTRSGEIEQVDFDLSAEGLELLVIDTQVRHQLAASAYGDRRSACELAAKAIGVKALRDATLADL